MIQQITAMIAVVVCGSMTVHAAQTEQPRFHVYDQDTIGLQLSNVRSGEVCTDDEGPSEVCRNGHRILITGGNTCQWSADTQYPCSWYGYEYDYEGAQAGDEIHCSVKRVAAWGEQTSAYTLELDANQGHVFQPVFKTYAPVDSRDISSEVHRCSYAGEPLTIVEYMIYYEPGLGHDQPAPSNAGDSYLAEVPDACDYLTEPLAHTLLRWTREVSPGSSTEHFPPYRSHCVYSARYTSKRRVSFLFNFLPLPMYDGGRLSRLELEYTAKLSLRMDPQVDTLENLGNLSFVFDAEGRTSLVVIAGIRGPDLSNFHPSELIAWYHLEDPDLSREQRQAKLVEQATAHLRQWKE